MSILPMGRPVRLKPAAICPYASAACSVRGQTINSGKTRRRSSAFRCRAWASRWTNSANWACSFSMASKLSRAHLASVARCAAAERGVLHHKGRDLDFIGARDSILAFRRVDSNADSRVTAETKDAITDRPIASLVLKGLLPSVPMFRAEHEHVHTVPYASAACSMRGEKRSTQARRAAAARHSAAGPYASRWTNSAN
jgi:hypothetical protein